MSPKLGRRQQAKYELLRSHNFTRRESRELSVLPRKTPALRLLVAERDARRSRFERLAATKIHAGAWTHRDLPYKWADNLARMYQRRGWRVKEGGTGNQRRMAKGMPNVWAMYRDAESRTGGRKAKGYRSPWEIHQLRLGKTKLQKGLVFVQKMERKARVAGGVSKDMIRGWIASKDEAIHRAKGRHREQLIIERNRLERLLNSQ